MAFLVNSTVKYCNSETHKKSSTNGFTDIPTVKYCNSETNEKPTTNGFSD
jgi:hypothetical protein